MSVMAFKIPDIDVYLYDLNDDIINKYNSNNMPFYEPQLEEIINERRNKNLFFTNNYSEAIEKADIIFICVDTPTKTYGDGKGKASKMSCIESCTRTLSKKIKGKKIIVENSTVPIHTAHTISKILSCNKSIEYDILSNPEFLSEGNAINELVNPDRILIGGENNDAIKELVELYNKWIPLEKIIVTSLWSSELSKLVSNALLAQRISSINAISELCEKVNADVTEISKVVGLDSRIGSKFLNSSVGFGGSCFQKDLLNLCYLCDYYNLHEVSEYFKQIILINDHQKKKIFTDNS